MHVGALDERNQSLPVAILHHHDVVGAGGEQMTHPPQVRVLRGDDLEALEIGPVELARRGRRQHVARDRDLAADQGGRLIAILDARQAGDDALALRTPADSVHLPFHTRRGQQPGLVAEDLDAGFGPAFQLDLPLHAMEPDNASDPDALTGLRRHQAASLPASFTRARTLSVSCAPFATQAWTLATSSSRRLSAPEATGL